MVLCALLCYDYTVGGEILKYWPATTTNLTVWMVMIVCNVLQKYVLMKNIVKNSYEIKAFVCIFSATPFL